MNKLLAALIAGAFALGSVAAMAATVGGPDRTPDQPVDAQKLKEQRAMAKAGYAKMSPAEQAAFKKGMAAQRAMDLQGQEAQAQENPPTTPEQQKALNAQKGTPKALPDAAAKQKALGEQEKASVKGGGG